VIAFIVTRRWCISLQRADNDRLLHGYETGVIMRSAEGGYSERHLPISESSAYTLTARDRDVVHTAGSDADSNGVAARGTGLERVRARLSRGWFGHNVQKPTQEELAAAHTHADHEHELQSGLDRPADGHQFDGHHSVDEESLRSGKN